MTAELPKQNERGDYELGNGWEIAESRSGGWKIRCRTAFATPEEAFQAISPESLREWVSRYGELSRALHIIAEFALDLTLAALTTYGVPEDICKRAFATHRHLLTYRETYTLRSLGEVERGQRDLAIDNVNCNAFGEPLI